MGTETEWCAKVERERRWWAEARVDKLFSLGCGPDTPGQARINRAGQTSLAAVTLLFHQILVHLFRWSNCKRYSCSTVAQPCVLFNPVIQVLDMVLASRAELEGSRL
jgi:hypothetical protein